MAQLKEIHSLDEWASVMESSVDRPVVVFKHSTTCPISANALKEFQQYLQSNPNPTMDYILVKVIESRPVSNQIAEDIQLKHESPQILLLRDKEQVWNASHGSITSKKLTEALQ